jgi:uncharacterized alpha-E superfamily protein
MADTQNAASEAGRALARARWGTTVLSQAVQTVIERHADLDDSQRGALLEAARAGGEQERRHT